jgi:hypothetical protein
MSRATCSHASPTAFDWRWVYESPPMHGGPVAGRPADTSSPHRDRACCCSQDRRLGAPTLSPMTGRLTDELDGVASLSRCVVHLGIGDISRPFSATLKVAGISRAVILIPKSRNLMREQQHSPSARRHAGSRATTLIAVHVSRRAHSTRDHPHRFRRRRRRTASPRNGKEFSAAPSCPNCSLTNSALSRPALWAPPRVRGV